MVRMVVVILILHVNGQVRHFTCALADAENTRRRAIKDREDAGKYAITSFAKDLLDFSDNFHRALAAIPQELHDDERVASIITGLG